MSVLRINIYALCEPDGAIRYIGRTSKSLERRLSQHLIESRQGCRTHKCNWIRSLLSSGKIPLIQIVGVIDGDGMKEEIAWIKYFRDEGVKLVNQTDGGDGMVGYKYSEEDRQKMSESRKGKKRPTLIGRHLSLETRKKIGEAAKGRPCWLKGKHHSLESRKKMSEARMGEKHPNWGKHFSKEICKRMSNAQKGKTLSLEHRLKIGLAFKGRVMSEEQKRKISEANKLGWNDPIIRDRRIKSATGKKFSDESRKKMSESARIRFARLGGIKNASNFDPIVGTIPIRAIA